jgi:formylglycine-generating enzyme required for sulfatase activity
MNALASVIADAITHSVSVLYDLIVIHEFNGQPTESRLRSRLALLMRIKTPPYHTAFAQALESAVIRLRRDQLDPELIAATLDLLAAPGSDAATLRRIAVTELLMSDQPNIGRLVDFYRRHLRSVDNRPARPGELVAVLRRLLGELLPRACAEQAALEHCLPDPFERARFAELRRATAAAATDDLALQQIIAGDGASIARVQQTYIQGDLYTNGDLPPPNLADLYERYRQFLIDNFASFDFRGILQIQQVGRLPLEDIYVPLTGYCRPTGVTTMLHTPRLRSAHQTQAPPGAGIAPLHDFIRDTPLLVVLGDPGMGKSTLVRYILLALARAEGEARIGLAGGWLPIFFPVAAFAAARLNSGRPDLAPLDYLRDYYLGLSQPDYVALFRRALECGRALLLFDGLDEVRSDRRDVARILDAFVREWDGPGNRFLATSRIAGYDAAPLSDALFTRVTMLPFDETDIRRFIDRWSRVYEQAVPMENETADARADLERRISRHAASLTEAVFAAPGITELARKPLLLTILALIHNQGTRLPDRRVDLYRLCVEALAETWNRARSLSGREINVYLGEEKLDERFIVNLLGPIALWIHDYQPGGTMEQRDLEQQIAWTLTRTDEMPHGKARRLAHSFIDLMRHDTGLIQEREYRRFTFIHQTFEEYLAARALLESVTVHDPDALIHRMAGDPRWREVLRLAVAASPQREAQRLLLHLLATPTDAQTSGWPVVLAGECLLDIGASGATHRAWSAVIAALLDLLAAGSAPLATRIAAARVLGRIGDPRLLPIARAATPPECRIEAYWCDIAAGRFWAGIEQVAHRRLGGTTLGPTSRHGPAVIATPFAIGRYPVTNAEFAYFIAAGGYNSPCWWTEHGRELLDGDPANPLREPALWQNAQFNAPAQPVVGVSWYEAIAFCNWLTAQGRAAGWLAADECLRLPTALEWERAARHTDRRRFPWGDDPPDSECANYTATGLRSPAPIGCFPRGAAVCGAQDMAGNVWEWTASRWEAPDESAALHDAGPAEQVLCRGGAFNWEADYLACGARHWFTPGYRFNLLGFRVVKSVEALKHSCVEACNA